MASDGAEAGTTRFAAPEPIWNPERFEPPTVSTLTVAGGDLLFTLGNAEGGTLWETRDATGPVKLGRLSVAMELGPPDLVGGRLVFAADDGTHGREFWATDFTPSGTRMVADVNAITLDSQSAPVDDFRRPGVLRHRRHRAGGTRGPRRDGGRHPPPAAEPWGAYYPFPDGPGLAIDNLTGPERDALLHHGLRVGG